MTISERLKLINDLNNSVRDERVRDWVSGSNTYITIDNNNIVNYWSTAANTIFNNNDLTFCCLDLSYQSYGWQTLRLVYAILDKEGNLIENIRLDQWTIKVGFIETKQPTTPISQIEIFRNMDQADKLNLTFYSSISFQEVWDYFIEVDKKCKTTSEALIYFDYFKTRLENREYSKSLQQYKDEVIIKENIIIQYQTLLDSIKNLVK